MYKIEEYHNNNLKKSAKKVTNNRYDIVIPQIHNDKVSYQENYVDEILKNKNKILSSNLYDEYTLLFESILEINNQFVGEDIYDVRIKLNHSSELINIKEQIIESTKQYCDNRINKHNNKDKNNLLKSIRIVFEVLDIFLLFASIKNSINILFVNEIFNFVPDYIRNNLTLKDSYRNTKISKLNKLLNLQLDKNNNIDELKTKLEKLSSNIIDMKKYLIDINCDKIEIIKDTYFIKWNWLFTDSNIFKILINNISLNINHKGYLIDEVSYIEYIYYDYNYKEHLQLSIFIMQKINNYLESIYNKENINKLENDLVLNCVESKEDIIITNNHEQQEKSTLKSYNINSNSTWNKFLKILKDNFGVVIAQGKGDDIKIYIKVNNNNNSKIYRTADISTKKREILIKTQENILKKIGIDVKDWNNFLK